MKWLFITILSAILSTSAVLGQHTTRSRLKPSRPAKSASEAVRDTVACAGDTAALVFSGYDKLLRSTKESFFVSNRTDSPVSRLIFNIEYLDMNRRTLDSRTDSVEIKLPPGGTRRVDIPSWDRQKTFYYYRSPQPKTAQATPYRVRISLVAALDEEAQNKR